MNNHQRIVLGFGITMVVFLSATLISHKFPLDNVFVPNFFISLTIELFLAIVAIAVMKKVMTYRIALPKIKTVNPFSLSLMAMGDLACYVCRS